MPTIGNLDSRLGLQQVNENAQPKVACVRKPDKN